MAGPTIKLNLIPKMVPGISYRQMLPAVGLKAASKRTIDRKLPTELIALVAQLVDREDRAKPLSDRALADVATARLGDHVQSPDIALVRKRLGLATASQRRVLPHRY